MMIFVRAARATLRLEFEVAVAVGRLMNGIIAVSWHGLRVV